MIKVEPIRDSINPQGTRLITMKLTYPKFLHQETLRHRTLYIHDCLYDPDFSFSVSSARAIPFAKLLEEVRSDELRAAPLVWGAEQKGMSPGNEVDNINKCINWLDVVNTIMPQSHWGPDEYITKLECVKRLWNLGAELSSLVAEAMVDYTGIHKSIANRQIEKDIHVNCLTTGTDRGWLNFFGLRLDSAADPTLQLLAQSAWKVWNESQPTKLQPGGWHLPFISLSDIMLISGEEGANKYNLNTIENRNLLIIKISAARCARLSYLSFSTNKRSTIEEDLELYNKLVSGNIIHASPLEHIATPDNQIKWSAASIQDHVNGKDWFWQHPHQSGNLGPGWRQWRKFLLNENIAPLPKEYSI